MADLDAKKRVITINGPIGSGKQKLAKIFAISCKNPKIIRMPRDRIQKYYELASTNNSQGYEHFIEEEISRITRELIDYFETDNENDLLIIITDVAALFGVLAKEEKSPKISGKTWCDLKKVERKYWKVLHDNAHHTYVSTETDVKSSLYNIKFTKQEEIPENFFTLEHLEKQHRSYHSMTRSLLVAHDFISEDGKDEPDKYNDQLLFLGREFTFRVYKFRTYIRGR